MTNDNFTEAAHESAASKYQGDWDPFEGAPVDDWGVAEAERQAYVAGAEWARTHLAAQEPTDAVCEAAAVAICSGAGGCDPCFNWDESVDGGCTYCTRHARAALSAARAARRDEGGR